MDLHARFKKLNDELLELSKEVFRAVRISPTKFAICFYDRPEQSMHTSVIDSRTAHEIKLLSDMDGDEMIAYGEFCKAIAEWCSAESPGQFPIPINAEHNASYRTLMDAVVSG